MNTAIHNRDDGGCHASSPSRREPPAKYGEHGLTKHADSSKRLLLAMIVDGKNRGIAGTSLMEAIIRLKRCCDERESEIHSRANLTPAEYVCLKEIPVDESMGASALSQRMGLSPSRGSRVIERLVHRGLLERTTPERDRRVTLLSLSTAGRSIKREIEACLAACDDRLRSRLSAREARRANEGLTILLRAMEAP